MKLELKDLKYTKEKTKEGLEYILYQDLNSYSVSITANIRLGANNGLIDGAAHFLEHVVLRSSTRSSYKVKQKELEFRGASHNGGTSYDFTRFYITLPYTELTYGFTFLSDTLINAKFDEAEVESERRIIADEIKKDLNDPWVLAYYTVKDNYLKPNSPYAGNILGSVEALSSVNIEDLKRLYTLYGPKNIILAVSGNFKIKEAKKMIAGFSTELSKNKVDSKLKFLNSSFRDPGKIILKPSPLSSNPIVSISTKLKGRDKMGLRESIVMALFQRMLAKGESSALFRELRDKNGYLYSYGLDNLVYQNFSLASLNYECNSDKFYEILTSISKVIKKVQKTGFSEKQLEHWKTFNVNRNLISNDTHTSIGRDMQWDYFYSKNIYSPKEKIEILMSVKLEEINEILKSIKPSNFEIAVIGNLQGVDTEKIKKHLI